VTSRTAWWAVVVLVTIAPTAFAHHSFAATYDADRTLVIEGTIAEFAWKNPHAHIYVNVTTGPLKGRLYTVELNSAESLAREGWQKTLLHAGDRIAITVHPARAGTLIGLCRGCAFTINGKSSGPRALPD
jgi:hypothetical protein